MGLVAFHGDLAIKKKYLDRVQEHRRLDQLAKGQYYEVREGQIRACAVGCTIEGSDHSKYQSVLGIPTVLAHLEDAIFEGLPNGEAQKFPVQFLQAIKPGADLSLVWPKFAVWLMKDLEQYAQGRQDVLDVLRRVGELYRRVIQGEQVPVREFEEAAWGARGLRRGLRGLRVIPRWLRSS